MDMCQEMSHIPPIKPDAGDPAPATGLIGGICQSAFADRKASATDAFGQTRPEALELGHPFVNAARPTARELGPVRTLRDSPLWQLRELHFYFIERHSEPLGEDNKRNPSKHDSLISTVARTGPLGLDQTLLLVKTQRRRGHPTTARNLTDCKRFRHTHRNITLFS